MVDTWCPPGGLQEYCLLFQSLNLSILVLTLRLVRTDLVGRGSWRVTGKTALQKYKRESRNKESTKKYKEGIEKHHTPQSTVDSGAHSYLLCPAVINNNLHVATVGDFCLFLFWCACMTYPSFLMFFCIVPNFFITTTQTIFQTRGIQDLARLRSNFDYRASTY